jgi:integrase
MLLDVGLHVDPNRITVGKWLAEWLATVRGEVSPKSLERYGEVVDGYLTPALGKLPLTKLAPSHIQNAYNAWAVGGRRDGKDGPLAPRTRRHIHRILNSALTRAVEQQLLARNPADVFRKRLPKVERKPLALFTAAQSAEFLNAIKHTHTYWPVLVALATGMRRGEVLGLRWKNVDLDRASLRVVESVEQTKAGVRFKAPKTERSRGITLPAFAATAVS